MKFRKSEDLRKACRCELGHGLRQLIARRDFISFGISSSIKALLTIYLFIAHKNCHCVNFSCSTYRGIALLLYS